MLKRQPHVLGLLVAIAISYGAAPATAIEVRTLGTDEFRSWNYPEGLITVEDDSIRVHRFAGAYNAVSDIDEYGLKPVGVHGTVKIRTSSGEASAPLSIDQRHSTWWQPDDADPVGSWWFELDLGRAVVADNIRLVFPDTVGALPFRQFTVYTSAGLEVRLARGNVVFERVGRPINGNRSRVVELDLETVDVSNATAPFLITADTLDFRVVRFVRFEATGKSPDAALAEIEVETSAFNLGMRITTDDRLEQGKQVWGGRARTSNDRECTGTCGRASGAEGLIDGDMGNIWTIEATAADDWRTFGHWSVMDMAQVFRVDRLVWIPSIVNESPFRYGAGDPFRQGSWANTDLLISDGTPDSRSDPQVEGPYEYDLLTTITNDTTPRRNFYDLRFPPRDVRLLMFRRMELTGAWAKALQMFIFAAEGYPAKVTMESDDIDLGGVFSVRQIEWDADIHPSTRVEVQTQTGDGYTEIRQWFLKNGDVLTTKEAWEGQKSRNRIYYYADGTQAASSSAWEGASAARRGDGGIGFEIRDPSWSSWSLPHAFSGQAFQSPTPRRWVRIRVTLTSEDPESMPVLRSLSFVMNSPVIGSGITSELTPRVAFLDTLQEFTYKLKPVAFDTQDTGFDRIIVMVPPEADDADLIRAIVGDEEAPEASAQLRGDSLIVALPTVVRSDSVAVTFRSRVFRSPTVFEVLVANSSQEDNLQGVRPADIGYDQVFVPEVVDATSLFHSIEQTAVFTPNGDGINDDYRLTFNILKADLSASGREPRVRVYDLGGRVVAELQSVQPVTSRAVYGWNGTTDGGNAVAPPGIYIVRIEIETDARDEVEQRLVNLAY